MARDRARRRPTGQTRRRIRLLAATMAVAGLVGLTLGLGVVALDRRLLDPPPVHVGTIASAQVLLSALVGGLITVAVFSLWMRTVVVGLVADQFSPRTLTTFLEDRFQRHLLGTMAAGMTLEIVLLLGLPTDEEASAPLLAMIVSVIVALGALAGVLLAIQHAIRTLSLPELVGRLTDQALEVLERQPGPVPDVPHLPRSRAARPVQAPETGWVVAVDAEAILAALPPGGVAHLHSRVGEFVTPRSTVVMVSPPEGDRAANGGQTADLQAVADAVHLARTRSPDLDLAFALSQLVDVAVHALRGSGKDTATAHEALVHLGAVLERTVERGLPPGHRAGEDGRLLFDEAGWDAADHVHLCIERLRDGAAREPETARHLLQLLGKVRATAVSVGDQRVLDEVGRQVDTLLALVDLHGVLPADRHRLHRVADRVLTSGHALASTRPRADDDGGV
jgi:uncharacterized membrane protein